MTRLTRRAVLHAGVIAGGASLIGSAALRAATGGRSLFSLGVASGGPSPDGMVLWTRLAPTPLDPEGGMPPVATEVRWEISATERFAPIRSGFARAEPDWGHSVHVDVTGLTPDRPYWYRFIAAGQVSPIGRTRTAPAAGAMVDRLRIAFGSCQNWEAGLYGAYPHMIADDPDLILFLGDYIYEGDPGEGAMRRHANPRPTDIQGYRIRYANYKSDPLLQAAHRAAPWVTTWDDHEVANNYANDLDQFNGDRAAFLKLRAAAYQAYYEHMPIRAAQRPDGSALRLYRTIDWGRLAQFQVIDDRQYRDPPPCQAPGTIARHLESNSLEPDCPERDDPRRSILGVDQEAWLMDRLDRSSARWNMLSQQTLMMPLADVDPAHPDGPADLYGTDTWAGYPACRDRIVRRWRDAKTPNPVILSGDIHSFVAGDHADPDDPNRPIASEFVGGAITSNNHHPHLPEVAKRNPGFRFTDIVHRGYGLIDVTPDRCAVAFRGLADVRDARSTISDVARFTVENGSAGVQSG
ncbi:alkaline phosphatase [Sphingomonas koreensis]|nr:alkaline phosphatase [Sphingomonas koreensis]